MLTIFSLRILVPPRSDWDDEDDGAWEPPLVDNPAFKGEWKQKLIDNPAYKGEWVHPLIANPEYAPEKYAKYTDLAYVGFELWTVFTSSILSLSHFRLLICSDEPEEGGGTFFPNHVPSVQVPEFACAGQSRFGLR